MIILDTDHMSILEDSEAATAHSLKEKLDAVPPEEVATTVISYEEQMRG